MASSSLAAVPRPYSAYFGPSVRMVRPMQDSPLEIIEGALDDLVQLVTLSEAPGPTSHTAVVAEGLDSAQAPVALARYLLGVLAGAVQLDTSLSEKYMLRSPDGHDEILRSVHSLVGTTNTFLTDAEKRFRDQRRNAWIGEGLAHAMLVVRNRAATACLTGRVAAISKPHVIPSEPGIDAVAVYDVNGEPFLAIGESKATEANALTELRKAAKFFAEVDAHEYNQHLRSALISLDPILPADLAPKVSDAIWRDSACYLPVIVHGQAFAHLQDRTWLASLKPPSDRRRLLVLRISNFHDFFNTVADTMRGEAASVVL